MNKNIIIATLLAVVLLLIIWLGLSMNRSEDAPLTFSQKIETKKALVTQKVEDKKTIEMMRINYVEGCDEYRDNYSFCNCTFDELLKRNSLEEIIVMSLNLKSIKTEEKMAEVVVPCIKYFNY